MTDTEQLIDSNHSQQLAGAGELPPGGSCHVDAHHLAHHHLTVLIVLKVTLNPMKTRWHTEILWQLVTVHLSSARLVSTDWLDIGASLPGLAAISWLCYVSTTSSLAGETHDLLWLADDQDGKQAALHRQRQYDVLCVRAGSVVKWELLLLWPYIVMMITMTTDTNGGNIRCGTWPPIIVTRTCLEWGGHQLCMYFLSSHWPGLCCWRATISLMGQICCYRRLLQIFTTHQPASSRVTRETPVLVTRC